MSEYNNNTTGGSYNYSSLGSYNAGYSMNVAPQGKVTAGAYIVPTWAPIGYNDLTGKGIPSRTGYSDIKNAYANSGSCQTTYRTSLCGNQ